MTGNYLNTDRVDRFLDSLGGNQLQTLKEIILENFFHNREKGKVCLVVIDEKSINQVTKENMFKWFEKMRNDAFNEKELTYMLGEIEHKLNIDIVEEKELKKWM